MSLLNSNSRVMLFLGGKYQKILFYFFFLSFASVGYADNCNLGVNADYIKHISKDVYHIYMFDAYLPIPRRYVLNITHGAVYEFNSDSLVMNNSKIGYIRAGKYSDFIKLYSKEYNERKSEKVFGKIFVDIYNQHPNLDKYGKSEIALIHDDEEFILIDDRDRNLWKYIFLEICGKKEQKQNKLNIFRKDGKVYLME